MDNSKVNDLIFRELIKRGYSLEGNTRVWNIADSKLWYLTPEQAQAYLDLEEEETYKQDVTQKEISLVTENLNEIISKFDDEPVNVIDVGCGDGKKAKILIEHFKHRNVRYCPIDISSYMVDKAIKNFSDHKNVDEVVEFQWNISDFENIENVSMLLRKGKYKRNLFLLLGNTLGNFEINELLYEIRSAMKSGDYLLIGNGLDNRNPQEILKAYDNDKVNEFLIHIPLQLGLEREDLKLGTRFANSRVELYYTIQNNKTIKFQGKEVTFNKGDQILASVSYKYSKADFISFLNIYFDEVTTKVSKDNSYALALAKK